MLAETIELAKKQGRIDGSYIYKNPLMPNIDYIGKKLYMVSHEKLVAFKPIEFILVAKSSIGHECHGWFATIQTPSGIDMICCNRTIFTSIEEYDNYNGNNGKTLYSNETLFYFSKSRNNKIVEKLICNEIFCYIGWYCKKGSLSPEKEIRHFNYIILDKEGIAINFKESKVNCSVNSPNKVYFDTLEDALKYAKVDEIIDFEDEENVETTQDFEFNVKIKVNATDIEKAKDFLSKELKDKFSITF